MDNTEIYKQAIEKFGDRNQTYKAIEELSELIKELAVLLSYNLTKGQLEDFDKSNLEEEIADVEIMLEQLKLIFDCHDIINTVKKQKIERLKGLVENG